MTPSPLSAIAPARLAGLRWVITDIDDTLTTEGRLTADVYAAMEGLSAAGIAVVPVTGRPAGWCDLIARQWPVAAVVGENGALWYGYDAPARRMRHWHAQDPATLAANRARLEALAAEAMAAVPGARIAADQPFRLFDIAVDFAEDAGPLPLDQAERIAAIFRAGGAAAKVSSIHVNAWIGEWDKRAGLGALFAALWDPLEQVLDRVAYLGDSPNDAPL
ncbi:MAG TPA: HAD-IIB family hydrolase, partial [Acetobacteraceae bacterium]|nr:HAD-IIB family hydrolase [Acetobacteraceae bacterium]